MIRTRQILAVTLVATALAADRAVAATAPMLQQQQTSARSIAGRFVIRLSNNFRRVVPAVRLVEARRGEASVSTFICVISDDQNAIAHFPISPFQFRLPPPAL